MANKRMSAAKLPKQKAVKVKVPQGHAGAAAAKQANRMVKAERGVPQVNPITGKTERNLTGGYYGFTGLV